MHRAHVFDIDRRAFLRLERDILDVLHALDVTAAAHVELGGTHFENLSTHVAVGHADFVHDLVEGDAVGQKLVRVEVHLVLFHETTDRRHFRNALYGFQRIAQVPVLEGAQFGEIVFAGPIHQRVFEHPPDARGVWADDGIDSFGQHPAHGAQILNDA